MTATQERQQATVFFTDIVGYTRLMNTDETKALTLLRRFKKSLEHFAHIHEGKIIQYYGDAALVLFNQPEDALNCAIQLQTEMKNFPEVPLRIGINKGEVVFEKENVFGDTVNIASRLESMGVEGSVLCSEEVRNAVEDPRKYRFADMGEFKLKNVSRPLNVFALTNGGMVVPKISQIQNKIARPATVVDRTFFKVGMSVLLIALLAVVGWWVYNQQEPSVTPEVNKSLAILPFTNLSENESNQFFCDGMMEDILNRLSGVKNLKVISRTSVQRYRNTEKSLPNIASELGVSHILEGSVRRFGDQIRVIVNLIQAQTDEQIWSESYDRVVDDIFGLQSEIASHIGTGLEVSLLPQENKLLGYEPTDNVEAYDFFLKGRKEFNVYQNSRKEKDLQAAQSNFRQALQLDENLAAAWAYIGCTYQLQHTSLGAEISYIDSAWDAVNKSISLNPNLPEGYLYRSEILELKKQRPQMEADLKQALGLAPNATDILKALGNYYAYETNDLDKSVPYYKKAISLEPFNDRPLLSLSYVYRKIGLFETARQYLSHAIALDPERISNYMRMADIHMLEDDFPAAQQSAKTILKINPDYTWGKYILAESLAFDDKYEEAEVYYREIEKEVNQKDYVESFATPPFRHRLGYVLWKTDRKKEAQALFDKMIDMNLKIINSDIDNLGGARYDLAAVHAFLGEKDEAIKWLEKIFKDGSWFDPFYTAIDPLLKPLRIDPRYQSILKEQMKESEEMYEKVQRMEEISFLN